SWSIGLVEEEDTYTVLLSNRLIRDGENVFCQWLKKIIDLMIKMAENPTKDLKSFPVKIIEENRK
ncbi:Hypothetical protein CINCED_3A005423, partial [Cinara cedri]